MDTKQGNTSENVDANMVTRPPSTTSAAPQGPEDLSKVTKEQVHDPRTSRKGLNANAQTFAPRNSKSGFGSGSDGHNTKDSPNWTSEPWSLVEKPTTAADGTNQEAAAADLPRRRSDTNPSEFDGCQTTHRRELEEIFNAAVANYRRDSGRLDFLTTGSEALAAAPAAASAASVASAAEGWENVSSIINYVTPVVSHTLSREHRVSTTITLNGSKEADKNSRNESSARFPLHARRWNAPGRFVESPRRSS